MSTVIVAVTKRLNRRKNSFPLLIFLRYQIDINIQLAGALLI